MNEIDPLSLDGHVLRLLVAVSETGSVTRAAERLGLTQSAVSHALDRLRGVTGDALFVRCGRGIAPTPQAAEFVRRAREVVAALAAFGSASGFEPARWAGEFVIAANDLQRDLLLPPLLRRLRAAAPGATLRVLPSGAPRAALLRDDDACALLLTPRPPDGADIVHRRLFEDRYVVFHDPLAGAPPADAEAWRSAEHVTVRYADGRTLEIDDWLAARGHARRFVACVPGMAAVAALLRGGPWLATLPARLADGALHGLAQAPLPVAAPPMPMYAVWHRRRHDEPAHRWLRGELQAVVAALSLS